MRNEENPGGGRKSGRRLSLRRKPRAGKTKEEKAAGSLIWTGRVLILASFPVGFLVESFIGFAWLAAAMLLVCPFFVAVYWHGIRVRRPEAAFLAVISLTLAGLWVWLAGGRLSWWG